MDETRTEAVTFPSGRGHDLSGVLHTPPGGALATALLAHCFTCDKEIPVAVRLARALCQRGVAVLRLDFTGLGESGGSFADSGLPANVEDLVAAADFLRGRGEAPELLVGHSLGGAAALLAAPRIPEARAVCTIAAPADLSHLEAVLGEAARRARGGEAAEATIAGRAFPVGRGLMEGLATDLLAGLAGLRRALLVMHSPVDNVVGIDHARRIFRAAKHPKSFVSLDDADHLLRRPADAEYAASVLAAWAGRYIDPTGERARRLARGIPEGEVVVVERNRTYSQCIAARTHLLSADEPVDLGGNDTGPSPYELLLAALGACTSMTIRMYARRKGWDVAGIRVRLQHQKVHAEDCADCETEKGKVDLIQREITLEGDLTEEQRERCLYIATRCPVNRTLTGEIKVRSRLAP